MAAANAATMVKWRCAFGCSNKEVRDNVSFYRFPKKSTAKKNELEAAINRRELWINAVKRAAVGSNSSRFGSL